MEPSFLPAHLYERLAIALVCWGLHILSGLVASYFAFNPVFDVVLNSPRALWVPSRPMRIFVSAGFPVLDDVWDLRFGCPTRC